MTHGLLAGDSTDEILHKHEIERKCGESKLLVRIYVSIITDLEGGGDGSISDIGMARKQ